jgi:hypothetical protein
MRQGSDKRMAWAAASATIALLSLAPFATPACAHGFGQRYDLPVPLWLWLTGAGAAVALSFAIIAPFVEGARMTRDYPRINLLRWSLGRLLISRDITFAAQALSVGVLTLVVAAGAIGNQNPLRNLAPTAIWVAWWVGFAYISALVGNLWAVVNPWSAVFRWIKGHDEADGEGASILHYPRWLGVWPAIALFTGFAWAELVFLGRALPAQLALMTMGYSAATWTGMAIFGRVTWLRHGDPFAIAFGLLARFAPTEIRVTNRDLCRRCEHHCEDQEAGCVNCGACFARAGDSERELNLRPFGAGLLRSDAISGSMALFVLLMLSTVTFDGFMATPAWANLESAALSALTQLGDARMSVISTLGLLSFPVLFGVVYRLFAGWMALAAGGTRPIATVSRAFVLSLIPIAIAYHLAHYFTYLLIQGQLLIPLVSDPFGFGWNLFGTAGYRPDIGIVGARFAWYTAVIAIVTGHVIAVYIAHVIAVREFGDRRAALRSQFAMLTLMVGYTMVSLWIIAQPIVETTPGGSR